MKYFAKLGFGPRTASALAAGVVVAGAAAPASAQVTVPASFTIDYDALATSIMTGQGEAILAGIVVLGGVLAIFMGIKLFKRLARG